MSEDKIDKSTKNLLNAKTKTPEPKNVFHNAPVSVNILTKNQISPEDEKIKEKIAAKSTTARLNTDNLYRCNALMGPMGARSFNELIEMFIGIKEQEMNEYDKRSYQNSIDTYYKRAIKEEKEKYK